MNLTLQFLSGLIPAVVYIVTNVKPTVQTTLVKYCFVLGNSKKDKKIGCVVVIFQGKDFNHE